MEGLFFGPELSQSLQKAIDKIVDDFNKDSRNPRFSHPFCLSRQEFELPLCIYLWSPLEQHGKCLKCIQHNSKLIGRDWKSVVEKKNKNNPRLLYCVSNNIILIQRLYVCSDDYNPCTFLSASKDLMNMLNEEIEQLFHFKMYHRSAFSYPLIDLVFQMISQGNNFKQITQMIANLRLTNFQSNHLTKSESLQTSLCSFPSSSNLEIVFLDVFQQLKDVYRLSISNDTESLLISTTHSLKISKKMGGMKSNDKKFVMTEMKLLLIIDENHCVTSWKMTENLNANELSEFLVEIKNKCTNLKYVVTDECCQELYSEIFGEIDVKLHLYHALEKIANLFPKKKLCVRTKTFLHDFSLIFREQGDLGPSQTKPTPHKSVIFDNLERFLAAHQPFLSGLSSSKVDEFIDELNNIKVHIDRGCLSDIGCGYGTYNNDEALKRLLDKSLLKGASYVGQELSMAVLSILFFHHNNSLTGIKHKCNNKITPVMLPRNFNTSQNLSLDMLEINFNIEDVDDLNDTMKTTALKFLSRIAATLRVVKQLWMMCYHRSFRPGDMLNFKVYNHQQEESVQNQSDIFKYNLNVFHLELGSTVNNGDSCFSSILEMVYQQIHSDIELMSHFVGLGLTQEIQQDILFLRFLIGEALQEDQKYKSFLTEDDMKEISRLKEPGAFSPHLSDFVVKVSSDVFKIPITVILSCSKFAVQTAIPKELISCTPIIIACKTEDFHYSSTKPQSESQEEQGSTKFEDTSSIANDDDGDVLDKELKKTRICHCKKGCKREATKRMCPCLDLSQDCTEKCQCRGCQNNKYSATKDSLKGCRCAISKCCNSDPETGTKNRCKCPCFKRSVKCTEKCRCKGCSNPFGAHDKSETPKTAKVKKETYTSYKPRRNDTLNATESMLDLLARGDCWTLQEIVTLHTCAELSLSDFGKICEDSINIMYSFVCSNQDLCPEIAIGNKSHQEIVSKLKFMRFL